MLASAVAALIRRRGTIVSWEKATPADPNTVDPLRQNPVLLVGGPRVITGPMGEVYDTPYLIRAFISKRVNTAFWASYGTVDQGDIQIDYAVPFRTEAYYGIIALPPPHLDAYNSGALVVYSRDSLIAKDRITINGTPYLVKNSTVPIQDMNVVVAYRVLLGRATY